MTTTKDQLLKTKDQGAKAPIPRPPLLTKISHPSLQLTGTGSAPVLPLQFLFFRLQPQGFLNASNTGCTKAPPMYFGYAPLAFRNRFRVSITPLKPAIMKKFATLLCLLLFAGWASAKEVNETVLKVFRQSFPGASNVSWSEEKDKYLVFFKRNETSYRLIYDKDGSLLTAYKYYGADDLPPFILTRVKNAYPGYTVHGITEVSNNTTMEYHIILETATKLLNLRSDPIGNLEVESRYKKAD
jgi:hypothetical protein